MKPWMGSAAAVVGGFLVTAMASTVADALMHATGIFPSTVQAMSDPLFAVAATYRAFFTVAGGFTTAHLAPDRPMRHAWILAFIGLLAGLGGLVGYFTIGGGQLGPTWYALSIPIEAIPCVWLGAKIAVRRRNDSLT
ncbi:MAG: hypothetical protein ABIN69_09715 [Aestuariivirga sp.]